MGRHFQIAGLWVDTSGHRFRLAGLDSAAAAPTYRGYETQVELDSWGH